MAKKKKAADKTAEMLEATSIVPVEEQTGETKPTGKRIEKIAEEIVENKALEALHEEVKKDEEEAGISETVLEATENEVTVDLQKKIDELQEKYIQSLSERDALKDQLDSFTDLSQRVDALSEDLQNKTKIIENYEFNESNYKAEILKLKDTIKDLEGKISDLANANSTLSKENFELKKCLTSKNQSQEVKYSMPNRFSMKNVARNQNGYSSWN